MSTPTEPTTPQPKPADAAGLRFHNPENLPSAGEPPWRFLLVTETPIPGEDQFWQTEFDREPENQAGNWDGDITGVLFDSITYRTKRPLPTPHAAEAGVRAIAEEICRSVFGEVPGSIERADEVADILARQRTAAETTGTGELSLKALWAKFHAMWGDARAGRTYCKDDWMEMQAMVNKLTATPPATQSALEQAREALWEYRVAAIADVKSAARWNSGEADMAEIRATEARLKKADKQVDAALAALNAVLPPAKRGDGV